MDMRAWDSGGISGAEHAESGSEAGWGDEKEQSRAKQSQSKQS